MRDLCNVGQPLMSSSKAAEIFYECIDLLDNDIHMLNQIDSNLFMFSKKEDIKGKTIILKKSPCIFYRDGKCVLGDRKPESCSNDNDVISTSLFKSKIKVGFSNKEFKNRIKNRFKEDMIMYIIVWYLNRHIEEDDLGGIYEVSYDYKLISINGKVSSIRIPKLKTNRDEYKIITIIYNHIQRALNILPYDYIDLLVNKLNKFIQAGNFKDCKMDISDIEKSSIYSLTMFRLYKTTYKSKSKEYSRFITSLDTYNSIKDINELLGGNTSTSIFRRERVECITDNNIQFYKIIMKNK